MRLGAGCALTNDTAAENPLSNTIGVVGRTINAQLRSLGADYPPFPRKETTGYRMVYRESTWKELSITLGLDAELLGPHTWGSD